MNQIIDFEDKVAELRRDLSSKIAFRASILNQTKSFGFQTVEPENCCRNVEGEKLQRCWEYHMWFLQGEKVRTFSTEMLRILYG
ncbi:hypothetical protein, partial [Glaesserella parasuis]|uniref:hypothetical protein n=1 Tax=Glaesserella parasuis TaxID=738 RepID=UPI003B674599